MKRYYTTIVPVLLAFAALYPEVTTAQTDVPQLKLNTAVEREMTREDVHTFQVNLESGQFMFATVEQRGIDVVVRVLDPEGKQLQEIDSPTGSQGFEFISLFPQTSGQYRLEVRPFDDEEAEPGRYAVTVERLEPAAATAAGKVDQLFAPVDRPGSPGAAVAIARDGAIVYKRGYGYAQLEYDIPITPSTVFHVASVSKQFTAFAITLLAEQGKLSLDDDIRTHLPDIPDFGQTITIRHLIHHTSGLRDQWNLLALAGWRLDDVITREHILRLIQHQRELNFDPGDEYLYSNTGYTLLAEIVARVTGQSFREWTAEHIFRPLGMTSTHFHDDHEMIVPNRAYSYSYNRTGGFRKSVLSYANVGATSLFTTVEDLAKWAHNLDEGRVGGGRVIDWMHTRGILNNGDTLGYAFGLGIGTYEGLKTVGHSGADAGFRSHLVRFPEHGFAIAVLSNLASFNPSQTAQRVADVYLADYLVVAEQELTEEEPGAAAAVDPAIYDDYVGVYELQPGLVVTVTRDGDRLMADATGQPTVELHPESDTTFVAREVDARVTFHRDAAGEVSSLTVLQSGQEAEAKRIPPFAPDEQQLAEYEGVYTSAELGTTYTIVVQEGKLVARHMRHEPIHLTAEALDSFSGDTWFFGQVGFERNERNEITGFRVSSGRVRNLRFDRQLR
ncbi:MAG: serine hydrolase [Gemmatimonadales bacterium]|nr:serine hydrolase [Gemmatimonadales bacterium]NIN10859.1 serine hydrolase [Gemmatimonadales bacterium]NIR02867.1 serine hydrolase [Gemmatimonadales bacterium]NIS66501.1 serine hydrolase [Gemmatimonadales bacterium]